MGRQGMNGCVNESVHVHTHTCMWAPADERARIMRPLVAKPVPSVWLVRSLIVVLPWVPPRLVLRLGEWVGWLLYKVLPWRLNVIRRNLLRAERFTPSSSLTCSVYRHFAKMLLLTLHLPERIVTTATTSIPDNISLFRDDCHEGGVILCSCHHGAWELLPTALSPHIPAHARKQGCVVYRPLHNTALDDLLRARRTAAARMSMIPDRGSFGTLLEALRNGGLVGLLADQRPPSAHSNVPITLFGVRCEMSPGLEALHRSTGAPVWFATLMLAEASDAHFCLSLERLAGRNEGRVETLSQSYANAVTRTVSLAPSQYFWFHDRWKAR